MATPRESTASPMRKDSETRGFPRHPFDIIQQIAPIRSNEPFPPAEFESVRCANLSRNGIAFYRNTPLETTRLVVALGYAPHILYFQAHVVSTREVEFAGRRSHQTGCQFTGRFEHPEHLAAVEQQQAIETDLTHLLDSLSDDTSRSSNVR